MICIFLSKQALPSAIAKGRASDWSGEYKFARNSDVDTGTDPEDIWMTGGTFAPFADDSTVTVVSASTDDDVGGTGARRLTVYGVDSSYARQNETVTLDGTSAVTLSNSYRLIYRAVVDSAGSGLTNAGALTFTSPGSVTMLTVGAGDAQSLTSLWPVATGETAYIKKWRVSVLTAAADVTARLFVFNVGGNVWNLKDILHGRVTGNSNPFSDLTEKPISVVGPSIVKITIETDTDNTDVVAGYVAHYEE